MLVKNFGKPVLFQFSMLHTLAIGLDIHTALPRAAPRLSIVVPGPAPLYKVIVVTTATLHSIFISKDTTAWKESCGETTLSFVQSLVIITGSKVYVCNDKIIICTNNAGPDFGFEPTVAVGTRSTTYAI
jgi:hypothetical protein